MINITDFILKKINITELACLTNKARPSIYKYLDEYNKKEYRNIPYTFILLFNFIVMDSTTKYDIVKYCNDHFSVVSNNVTINEIISLLKANESRLDLSKIKQIIEKDLK